MSLPSQSGLSNASISTRKTCDACGKPLSTSFSEPLKKYTSYHRLYHEDCQARASFSVRRWIYSACTIRKRRLDSSSPTTSEDVHSCQPSVKRRKTESVASQDLDAALDLVIANALHDPRLERAIAQLSKFTKSPPLQHLPSFSNQSKELSPPCTPERLFEPAAIKPHEFDTGIEVKRQESLIKNVAVAVPKMEDNESFDGIPLGDGDVEGFSPSKKLQCSICRKLVISNHHDNACVNCLSVLPGTIHFANKSKLPRPGSLASNPIKLEEMEERISARPSPVNIKQARQHSQGMRPTIEAKTQPDRINSDSILDIDEIQNTIAAKVHTWQKDVKPINSGSSIDEQKTRVSWSTGQPHPAKQEQGTQVNHLYDRLRGFNTQVEDLNIQVRNLTSQLSESKKEHIRELREKDEEIKNIKKNLEHDRRIGQRHIVRLRDEIQALKTKQANLNRTINAPGNAAYSYDNYEQLKGEFHALRKERKAWQVERVDLEQRVQRFRETLINLDGMKNSHMKVIIKLRRQNERLTDEVETLKATQETEFEQEELAADFERVSPNNANLKQEIVQLKKELASKEEDLLAHQGKLHDHIDQSQRGRSPSVAPDITDFRPMLHQDLLLKQWPLIRVDRATKVSEIAARERGKELIGHFSQQARRERGKHLHHTKSIRWTARGAPQDDNDDAISNNGSNGSDSTTRRMVAVRVPSRLSSEERSLYNEHQFDSDGDCQMGDATQDDPPFRAHKKNTHTRSHKAHRPPHQQREETEFIVPDDDDDDNSSQASDPSASASSSSGIPDPVDLETRGAPFKSSLARLNPRTTNPGRGSHAAGEDTDVSPPPQTTRNELSMTSLLKATGISNKETPAIRNGKLCMQEGSENEGQTGNRRTRRQNAWPVDK